MKLTLIAALIVFSTQAFSQDRIKIQENSIQSMSVTTKCVPDQEFPSLGYKDQLFTLSLQINNEVFTKQYRSDDYYAYSCPTDESNTSKSLLSDMRNLQDADDGNVQVLQSKESLVCFKDVVTLVVSKSETTNILKEVISSYKVVPCP